MSAYIENPRERRAAIKEAVRASARHFFLQGGPWDANSLMDRLAEERGTPFAEKHYAAMVCFRKLNVKSRHMLVRSLMVEIHDEEYERKLRGGEGVAL
jgi:hypothetical protein